MLARTAQQRIFTDMSKSAWSGEYRRKAPGQTAVSLINPTKAVTAFCCGSAINYKDFFPINILCIDISAKMFHNII